MTTTDLFTDELRTLNNDQRYSAIAAFAQAQPIESNRHDFKLIWTNDALKDVAAFANTFGGILIVGVEKGQKDVEPRLAGVPTNAELTTGIASSIATNISPTPSYDIVECSKPGESNLRFCIVRVRNDFRLYLVTKKDLSPAWTRNADQTVRADAAQLRSMIDRERQQATNQSESLLYQRAQVLLTSMPIACSYQNWPTGQRTASGTYLKLALIPSEGKHLSLDGHDEKNFVRLIYGNYRRVQSTLSGSQPAVDTEHRSADYYEYRWYHKNLDYEGRWRMTNALEVAHATQIKEDQAWSVMDVVSYVALLLKIGAQWWKALNYFGSGVLLAELVVEDVPIRRGRSGQFPGLFNPVGGDFAISPNSLTLHEQQSPRSLANIGVDFSRMREGLPSAVTELMNGLLRSLGHSMLKSDFEDDMRKIFR